MAERPAAEYGSSVGRAGKGLGERENTNVGRVVLRSPWRLAVLTAIIALPFCHAAAEAQSFEELVEDALQRQQQGEEPAPGQEPQPIVPAPGEIAPLDPQPLDMQTPGAAPTTQAPALKPVEPGPRAYTPPVVDKPAEEGGAASDGTTRGAGGATTPSDGATSAPEASGAPDPAAAEDIAPGEERTRESLQAAEINAATFSEEALAAGGANPLILKAQILLDRAGASPGAIDGYAGGNFAKAIAAVETVLRGDVDGKLDPQVWKVLHGNETADAIVQYTITAQDLSYPFAAAIPEDFVQQAQLPSLAYTSPEEMFAERFHMDVKLLKALNPEADFSREGTAIWVAAVEAQPATGRVVSIVADKTRRQVRAYDAQNRLIAAYPATIGSGDTPSPVGQHRVETVAPNPVYYYEPANFVQSGSTEKLTLPPGPNNPVGSTWIGLSGSGCGIHGTPSPTKIGKTASHGCVRLTNWDAEELASMVEPGVVVSFME